MEKIKNKFDNKEKLDFKELKYFSETILKEFNDVKIEENKIPYFDSKDNIIYLSDDVKAYWFLNDYFNYYKGTKIVNFLNKEEILENQKKKQNNNTNFFNLLLLSSVLHEIRHFLQKDILENNHQNVDIEKLKNP